ncbi:hypothetical protein [Occultella glacieicola]|uniref:hypothetical protein n=1 Tax=Occultella glacieicola TaxID=2518684 RepID=UPI001404369A|nr:hypothetical protein [Occultella glacieicola]
MSRLAAALLGGGLTVAASVLLRDTTPGGATRWQRSNYRGTTVSLLGGVATAQGSVWAGLGAGGRAGAGAALASAVGGTLGAVDDLDPDATASKGLRGHLGALARGEVTTGAVKLLGIGASAVVAAAIGTRLGARSAGTGTTTPGLSAAARGLDVLTSGALVAGTANLINLFDLRPGRGLKAAGAIAAPLAVAGGPGAPLATGALAVIAASWTDDLNERTMLGDTGANSLGALVGTAFALHPSARVRGIGLTAVVALTLLSEKVSFSKVIEATPVLRRVDGWGRTA